MAHPRGEPCRGVTAQEPEQRKRSDQFDQSDQLDRLDQLEQYNRNSNQELTGCVGGVVTSLPARARAHCRLREIMSARFDAVDIRRYP